jgi:two-component system response regulator AtoC
MGGMTRALLQSSYTPAIFRAERGLVKRKWMLVKYPNLANPAETGNFPVSEERAYIAGVSPEILAVQKLIAEIAPTDIPVLLEGESGVGKEIAALQIHEMSRHRAAAFEKLSCAAFMPDTFRTKLLSFENGKGEAEGNFAGTLFFDEIAELDSTCQRHLLHSFPAENGLSVHQSLAGRIISCTTKDLETEVHEGRFRSELFYRLNGVCLRLPPLRRRKQDIPLLAEHFLARYAKLFQRAPMSLSAATSQLLAEHSWPGNIRELENTIKKIVALDSEELGVLDLRVRPMLEYRAPELVQRAQSLKATSRAASQQAERELILQTLERTHWNRKRAAAALQISYKALLYKLKQIQIPGSGEV